MITALVVKMVSGKLTAVGGESTSAMLDLAKEVRVSGMMDGEPAISGVVLRDDYPVKRFRCEPVIAKHSRKRKAE